MSTSSKEQPKDQPSNSKRKHSSVEGNDSLEQRISSLEKVAKVELNELKEKVRTLCLQEDPSNALILLTLEELAKTARRGNHEDAEVF